MMPTHQTSGRSSLPSLNSPTYHLLLGAIAILILGPLTGVTAAYMNFSLGFFVGGQVLAGILGSAVTYGYGAEGKHGANYMQTMAASVATMSAMAVLIQSMTWMGLPEPPVWQLVLYFMAIGMFGVGVGMFYTPILVDRMQLTYPSGLAVANILRALTDVRLLRRSIAQLGWSTLGGLGGGLLANRVPKVGDTGIATSTIGAGMITGIRVGLPALVVALVGAGLTPWLRQKGWLEADAPFRKIGFILALGTILGASIVDLALIAVEAVKRVRQQAAQPPAEDWKRVNTARLFAWVLFWGAAVVLTGHSLLQQPIGFLCLALVLVVVFVLVNGISNGLTDWNPISSAFVITVFIMAGFGLKDPKTGLMCASILMVSCAVGVDMQQDRSTGWRLGSNRIVQFRYQVIGIVMGAVMAVVFARLFMAAYPVLKIDSFANPNAPGVSQWNSAMTYKVVGALRGLTEIKPHVKLALELGIAAGLVIEVIRKLLKASSRWQAFKKSGRLGYSVDFVLDAMLLGSPYASSFGGFVELNAVSWFAMGGAVGSLMRLLAERSHTRRQAAGQDELPEDMSTTSLVGGGLIAGDSLAALGIGVYGLLSQVLR